MGGEWVGGGSTTVVSCRFVVRRSPYCKRHCKRRIISSGSLVGSSGLAVDFPRPQPVVAGEGGPRNQVACPPFAVHTSTNWEGVGATFLHLCFFCVFHIGIFSSPAFLFSAGNTLCLFRSGYFPVSNVSVNFCHCQSF